MNNKNLVKKTANWISLIFLFSLLMMACDSVTSSSQSNKSKDGDTATNTKSGTQATKGSFEVRMYDAPVNYDAVNVTVDRVEIKGDSTGWHTISEPNETYNLLELTNGAYTVLGDTTLKVGTYQQIRLILNDQGNSVLIDSTEHSLRTPSGQQSGLKLNINAEIKPDVDYVLLLDFDASRSVVKAGESGKYILKPVIRATNKAISGNIEGTIQPVKAKPIVYAIAEKDTLASTFSDTTNGNFKLTGLKNDSYTISFDPRDTSFTAKNISDVNVTAGETTKLDTVKIAQK